jgi:hypothetical protein
MYFWRIEDLKKDLIAKPLTDREVLPYLLIFVGITALIPIFPVESMNLWDYAATTWTLLLAVAGTLYAYQCNGAAAGTHFVQRYLSIGWVVAVRWTAVVMAAFVVLLFLVDTSGDATTPTVALFWMIAEVVLYERMGHHIRLVATAALRSGSTLETDAQETARGSP